MKLDRYELKAEKSLTNFEFISEGKKGRITKLVQYSETNLKGFYNLGFGDKGHLTGDIDDRIISNNDDSQKVLATVAATVYTFTDKYPNAWVYATGISKTRPLLYKMGISRNLTHVQKDYDVYGLKEGEWQEFEKDNEYEAFLVSRKYY